MRFLNISGTFACRKAVLSIICIKGTVTTFDPVAKAIMDSNLSLKCRPRLSSLTMTLCDLKLLEPNPFCGKVAFVYVLLKKRKIRMIPLVISWKWFAKEILSNQTKLRINFAEPYTSKRTSNVQWFFHKKTWISDRFQQQSTISQH